MPERHDSAENEKNIMDAVSRANRTKAQTQYERMTETPVPRLIIRLAIPTIISMMITNIYNLADTAFVGRLGNSASGAVGVVFGFMAIIQAIGFLFGQGAGNLVAGRLGAQKSESASAIASTGLCLSFLLGIVLMIGGLLGLDPLVWLLGSTETIAVYARTYIFYILLATPLMTASFTMNNLLRYEGKAALGTIGLLVGAVLNICGDPILMFGMNLGIAGAGLSTAISQSVSFLILLSMFLTGKTTIRLSVRKLSLQPAMMLAILTTGLPSLLRQGLNSLTTVMLNAQASAHGDEAVAAMSIVSRIVFFVFAIAIGIGQGFQPVSGFNYGARKYERVKKAYFFTLLLAEAVMIVTVGIVLLYSAQLIGLFRDDAQVIAIGVRALRLQAAALLVLPICMCTEMLLQSTGQKVAASMLSSMRSGIYFIPALLILARMRGLYGIEEAQPLAFVLAGVSALPFAVRFFHHLNEQA